MSESDRFIGKRYLPPVSVRDVYAYVYVEKRNQNGTYHTVPIHKRTGRKGSGSSTLVQHLEQWTEIK